jgi:trehalose/maltose hydrolase-like predicted phosphorylase
LDVNGLKDGQQVIITDVLDGAGAQRVENEQAGKLNDDELEYGIYSAVNPLGIQNVTAWEISTLEFTGGSDIQETEIPQNIDLGTNKSTAAQAYSLTADKDGSISVFKAVGIASSDAFADEEKSTALASAKEAKKDGWEKLVSEHKDAWESLWSEGGEIEILGAEKSKDNDLLGELQTTTRSSLFHLLSNIRNGNEGPGLGDNSIAPAGLTSDSYAGGIFWDAETWMYPSLLSLFPDYAMSINNYRSKNLGAAMENVKQFNRSGLLYPWVSFRFGNCTGKLPSDTW